MSLWEPNTRQSENQALLVGASHTNVQIGLGEARDNGHSTYVRSTYAARYNFAVRQYNAYESDNSKKKMTMRGGRFFLYNIVVIIFFIAAVISTARVNGIQMTPAVGIGISLFYLLITFYNWFIYRKNGCLIHDQMIRIADYYLTGSNNEHIIIPVHANIENRQLLAATDGEAMAVLTRLQRENQHLTNIEVMLYGSNYLSKYLTYPKESSIHFFLFICTLGGSIYQFQQ